MKKIFGLIAIVALFALTVMGFTLQLGSIKDLAAHGPEDIVVTKKVASIKPAAGDSSILHKISNAIIPPEETDPKETKETASPNPSVPIRALGSKNAPITIHEYASLTCSHCADFHKNVFPQIKENYIDTGNVYFIFHDFPLNAPALTGSMVARCLPENRFFGFISLLFKTVDSWAAGNHMQALKQNAKLAGMKDSDFESCVNDAETKNALITIMQDTREKWEITSTPSFIINNGAHVVRGYRSYDHFSGIFDEILGVKEE